MFGKNICHRGLGESVQKRGARNLEIWAYFPKFQAPLAFWYYPHVVCKTTWVLTTPEGSFPQNIFSSYDGQKVYHCCNLLLPSPPHVNKPHCLDGSNLFLEIHPTRGRCQAQVTDKAAPAYTESSMDRFNRGGTQVEEGATPYYGSPFRAPMEPETPVPAPKENETEAVELETAVEMGTPVVEPTQPDVPDEVSDGDSGDKGECKQPEDLPPVEQLSWGAVDRRLRRIMTPRVTGEYKVPKAVVDQWKDKTSRPKVMSMFEKAGYSPDRGLWLGGWVQVVLSKHK